MAAYKLSFSLRLTTRSRPFRSGAVSCSWMLTLVATFMSPTGLVSMIWSRMMWESAMSP